jgi:putative acyl-CoA dehydrogenase
MATHVVENQVPPFEGRNLFDVDPVLPGLLKTLSADAHETGLREVGERTGSAEYLETARRANRNPPVLRTHDRFGNRVDDVDFDPSWHELLDGSIGRGMHAVAWTDPGGWVARASYNYLESQVEPGHWCPVSMTASAVGAVRMEPDLAAEWEPRLLSRVYDPTPRPAGSKSGVLVGMGMTEKQGGSDVRANTTTASPLGDGRYRIEGHKWFTSAPTSDAFLVLAQAPGGLTCFFVPRFDEDGSRNAIRIQRLKDKLGNRSNASSEVEFEGATAHRVGEEGRGVVTIIEMVNGTRLDCIAGSAGIMRQAVSQAIHHARHRSAFGSKLFDKPLMRNVLCDLEIEVEAAAWLMGRVAHSFDRAGHDPSERQLRRILTPIAKYWVTKRCTEVVRESLECLGGNGYVEESLLPMLYRESPLNAIWEGSGNVIALDVLRVVRREPEAVEALVGLLRRGSDEAGYDAESTIADIAGTPEAGARSLVERLAVLAQAALLTENARPAVAEAFVASRLEGRSGRLYGTLTGEYDADAILEA